MGINTNVGNKIQPITGASKGIDIQTTGLQTIDAGDMKTTNGGYGGGSGGGGVNGAGIASAGISALTALPGIIANASMDPSEIGQTRDEVKALVKAQNMNYITQGMEVGGSIGSIFGPIGGLIGTAVGGLGGVIAGDTQKGRAINEFNRDENEEVTQEWDEAEAKRLQNYFDINSSERMEAEMNLMKQSQGYIT